MDVFHQRLEQEHGESVILTPPTVPYTLHLQDGRTLHIKNPSMYPTDQKACPHPNDLTSCVSSRASKPFKAINYRPFNFITPIVGWSLTSVSLVTYLLNPNIALTPETLRVGRISCNFCISRGGFEQLYTLLHVLSTLIAKPWSRC